MVGTIKYWNSEKQFGFLVTEDGQEFYVGAGVHSLAGLISREHVFGSTAR
jgi:cold shock CspA family protein